MLILEAGTLLAIQNEGEHLYPSEACGLLAGKKEADTFRVMQIFPMKNQLADATCDRYLIDPKERAAAEGTITERGMEMIGFYHSHPDHDAYFSQTDLENSEEYQFGTPWLPPTYVYLVLSVKKGKAGDDAAFIIKEGVATATPRMTAPVGRGEDTGAVISNKLSTIDME
jgi:proteasome lid subunit RPN8/RPN11